MDDLYNLFIVAMFSLSPVLFILYLCPVSIAFFIFHSHFLFTAESVEFLLQFRFKATLILCADGHVKMHGSYYHARLFFVCCGICFLSVCICVLLIYFLLCVYFFFVSGVDNTGIEKVTVSRFLLCEYE